jgi:hypothetical protein
VSPDTADAAIAREIAHHRALGVVFEWKLYPHDEPADLGTRLERQGFVAGEREAVLVCDVTTIRHMPTAPDCRVVPVEDPEGLVRYRRVAEPWKGLGSGVARSSGIRTAKRDVDLVGERLKAAERDHEEHYGKQKR